MSRHFHMVVMNATGRTLLHNGHVVDQIPDRNELTVDEDTVLRRQKQIAGGYSFTDGILADAYGSGAFRMRMGGKIDPTFANPLDRLNCLGATAQRDQHVARSKLLDRHFAV